MLSEKDMEDAICQNPERYLGEKGLKFIARQYSVGNYRFDLLFEDRHGDKLIVELQRGTLDREHHHKIQDYYEEYKVNNPKEFVDLMVIANRITYERRRKLSSLGVEFKEISESEFLDVIEVDKDEIIIPIKLGEIKVLADSTREKLGSVVEAASVKLSDGTYKIERYANKTVKAMNLDTGQYVAARPVLRKIVKEKSLGIDLNLKTGREKSPRNLGKQVIRALIAQGKCVQTEELDQST